MPFSTDQFFTVFRQYNEGVWPAQLGLLALAAIALLCLALRRSWSGRATAMILALLWLWSGGVYHGVYFSRINPAAWGFGALFIVQGLLLAWFGAFRGRLEFGSHERGSVILGSVCVLYALIAYPLVNRLTGHGFPQSPSFGVPCPLTIFTLGLFFFTGASLPRGLLAIPLVWAAIGSFAAVELGVLADYGLLVAGLLGLSLLRLP